MRTFKSAYECDSLEEFVNEHHRLKFGKGTRGISIENLKWMADSKSIKYKSNITRDALFDLLKAAGVTPMELFETYPYSMGVIYNDYIQRFNVTKSEYDKLKRRKFFEIIDYDQVRLYGQYVNVPIFSAPQFFTMTREKIDETLASKVPRKCKPTA